MVKSLYEMHEGEKGRIINIKGGKGKVIRLAELGLLPGEEVTLFRKGFGPIAIKVKDTSLALGRGIAQSILVEVKDEED